MKITVLAENIAGSRGVAAEHGLSLYIETDAHRLLFDMGQTDVFAQNARLLGVDLAGADIAVLSHGHYDHGGGLSRFLELNSYAPVYLSRFAFERHLSGAGRDIGIDTSLSGSGRLVAVDDSLEPGEGLELCSCNDAAAKHPIQTFGMLAEGDAGLEPEDFRHELYLLIRDGRRTVLVSGCSHKGVRNLVDWFRPDVFIGGFHMMDVDMTGEGRRTIAQTADELMTLPTMYYTCHCTGAEQYAALKERMGGCLQYLACGDTLEL